MALMGNTGELKPKGTKVSGQLLIENMPECGLKPMFQAISSEGSGKDRVSAKEKTTFAVFLFGGINILVLF